jgi:hypothetical protein
MKHKQTKPNNKQITRAVLSLQYEMENVKRILDSLMTLFNDYMEMQKSIKKMDKFLTKKYGKEDNGILQTKDDRGDGRKNISK